MLVHVLDRPLLERLGARCRRRRSTAQNRKHFRALVEAGPPPGLAAYEGETPIAWCRVMPRDRLPGLANSRYFKTDLDIEGVWSLSCFVVTKPTGAAA